ncbi:MAG: murein L,D-transpeptidase catalytic domain family protein, partial [Deltaproteobacteria bacterium]|nr:murein L,D-transpeptidase catalytic domain family protein [Deltaproteobacteria bacterium]
GLTATVLDAGLRDFAAGWALGDTVELEYGIIDYTLPSIEPRFFVLDLRKGDLLYAEMVSHGEGSQDPNDLTLTGHMSNLEGSHASSVGLVVTAETYNGSNGYSMRLDGLEVGFNDNDRDRAIVVHGADYATQSFVNSYGYLGRSWGCPAIDPAVKNQLIDTLTGGRLLLKYFDDQDWLSSSVYVGP